MADQGEHKIVFRSRLPGHGGHGVCQVDPGRVFAGQGEDMRSGRGLEHTIQVCGGRGEALFVIRLAA